MAIIKFVEHDPQAVPTPYWKRLAWFVGLWSFSTVAMLLFASLLHMLIPR